MWTWIKTAYKTVSNWIYRPVRLIPSLWAQHVVTWVAHGAVTAGVVLLGYWLGGDLGAWIGFVVAGVFYAARETLGWPITRPQVDHFGDVAGPIVLGSGLLFWLLR